MEDTKLDRMKRKISKLMNLASGTSNEGEASNAMRHAANLMKKFHISEGECSNETIVTVNKQMEGRKIAKAHETKLFWAISRSMGVYGIYSPASAWRNEPCHFICVGHPTDIELSWYMFIVCLGKVKEQTTVYSQGKKLKRSELNDYAMGLVFGLARRFSVLREECNNVESGTGMVPVDTRWSDAKSSYKCKTKSSALKIRNSDHLINGVDDSKDIKIHSAVSGNQRHDETLMRLN